MIIPYFVFHGIHQPQKLSENRKSVMINAIQKEATFITCSESGFFYLKSPV
jgi:hypothetical protein